MLVCPLCRTVAVGAHVSVAYSEDKRVRTEGWCECGLVRLFGETRSWSEPEPHTLVVRLECPSGLFLFYRRGPNFRDAAEVHPVFEEFSEGMGDRGDGVGSTKKIPLRQRKSVLARFLKRSAVLRVMTA